VKTRGSILLIVALAVVILAMVGYALVMARPSGGSGSSVVGTPGATFTVSLVRTPGGISATVTALNKGSEDLKDLRITRAEIASMTGAVALPFVISSLPRGATSAVTLSYSGPAPAPQSAIKLELRCDYRFGLFGKGSASQDLTTIVP